MKQNTNVIILLKIFTSLAASKVGKTEPVAKFCQNSDMSVPMQGFAIRLHPDSKSVACPMKIRQAPGVRDRFVSYVQVCETSAGGLKSIYPSKGKL